MWMTPWRNGSASDSRSEGCVFKSRRGQNIFFTNCSFFRRSVLINGIIRKIINNTVHRQFMDYSAWELIDGNLWK